jgi:hypothetical protein
VFVLIAGSRAITNNTASCSYYFITDFIYSFAVVGVCWLLVIANAAFAATRTPTTAEDFIYSFFFMR